MAVHSRSRRLRRSYDWRRPPWLRELPPEFQHLLREVYDALENDARALPAMGIRTLIDQFATRVVGDLGPFARKLEALQHGGILGAEDRKRLTVVIDAGSAAAHRGLRPTPKALRHMMECVEHLLWGQFACRASTRQLRRTIPRRRRSQPRRLLTP
jgi:hypothetical protein